MGLRDFLRGRKATSSTRAPAGSALYLGGNTSDARRLKNFASFLQAISIPNVAKCVNVIASNFAATPLVLRDADGTTLDLEERLPALAALIKRPNPEMRSRQFMQHMVQDYLLTGNSVVLLDSWSGLGTPGELWRLDPSKLSIFRESPGVLRYGLEVTTGGVRSTQWYDGQTEILHTKNANPTGDGLWGLGNVECGEITLSKDRRINELVYNFVDRGAVIEGVLTSPPGVELSEEDRRALIADWTSQRSGSRRWKTALLWGGADWKPVQEPLGSVPVVDLLKMSRNDIFELFGVPPQVAGGDFSDSNYRNSEQSVAFFHAETLAPILDQFCEDFWQPLLDLFADDPALRLEYEHKEVVDYSLRAQGAAHLATTAAYTVNDLRIAGGYDVLPDDNPMGAMIPVPQGVTYQSEQETPQPQAPAASAGAGAPAPESGSAGKARANGRVTVSGKAEPSDTALVAAAYRRWAEEADAPMWDALEEPGNDHAG